MTTIERREVSLLQLRAADGRMLDALLYEPSDGACQTGILHLHGKGSSFLGGPGRFVPPHLPRLRHLVLNMRFRDLGFTRTDLPSPDFTEADVPVAGGWWERIDEGHLDVDAGVAFLREHGTRDVFVAGHSSGGFYAGTHAATDAALAGTILLSPLTSNKTALARWFPDGRQLEEHLRLAATLVDEDRGHHVVPLDSWYYAISARSLLERAAEADDVWLDAMNHSCGPVLFLWGSQESRDALWRRLFHQLEVREKRLVVLEGAEHHFVGHEQAVSTAIGDFVTAPR